MLHEDGAERFAVAAVCAVDSAVGNGTATKCRPFRAARGAERIACGQSFAPRGVNRMELDPSLTTR